MPKRAIARFIVVSLALGLVGCGDNQPLPRAGGSVGLVELAVVTAPIWVPVQLIVSADERRKASEAAEKLRPAAEGGDAKAQYELGGDYWVGRGLKEDEAEACKWYQKSADQGSGEAQISLGLCYEIGHRIAQDNVQAGMWYTIAASAENRSADTTGTAIWRRGIIEASMTTAEIAEARKRAQEWTAK